MNQTAVLQHFESSFEERSLIALVDYKNTRDLVGNTSFLYAEEGTCTETRKPVLSIPKAQLVRFEYYMILIRKPQSTQPELAASNAVDTHRSLHSQYSELNPIASLPTVTVHQPPLLLKAQRWWCQKSSLWKSSSIPWMSWTSLTLCRKSNNGLHTRWYRRVLREWIRRQYQRKLVWLCWVRMPVGSSYETRLSAFLPPKMWVGVAQIPGHSYDLPRRQDRLSLIPVVPLSRHSELYTQYQLPTLE